MNYLLILLLLIGIITLLYFLSTRNVLFTDLLSSSSLVKGGSNFKQNLNKLITKFLNEKNMSDYEPFDFTHISIDKNGKSISIDVWVRKKELSEEGEKSEWNHQTKLFTITIEKISTNGGFKLIDIKEKENNSDIGLLIPENTNNFSISSWGIPGIIRGYLGSLRSITSGEENTQFNDIPKCEKGGGQSSNICIPLKEGKLVIGPKNKIIEYQNKHKMIKETPDKFVCEVMIPEHSDKILPNSSFNLKCHVKLDQDSSSHWIAEDKVDHSDYSQFEQNETTLGYKFDSQ